MRRRILGFVFALTGLLTGSAASAIEFSESAYEVYYGDFNNDGHSGDIYFHHKDIFVLIHGDIAVPIFVPGEDGFVYYADGNGSVQPLQLTKQQLSSYSLATLGTDYFFIDTNNDGYLDVVVNSQHGGDNSFTVMGSSSQSLPSITQNGLPPENIQAPSAPAIADASMISTAEQSASDQIESTVGSFRVDESGAATYSVPIMTAVGTAGVSPDISLNYSSAAGRGLLGQGWSISGLGAIARCRQSMLEDKNAVSIRWNSNDRFCLNGQRLVMETGTFYGSVGATYKTAIDTFVRVTSVGGSAGRPDYFLVTAKDGSTTRYGNVGQHSSERTAYASDGTKQTALILSWGISEFSDNANNRIVYSYDATADHFRIDEISYAYGQDSSAGARLVFDYSNGGRQDAYVGGYLFSNSAQLNRIYSFNGNDLLREYRFQYYPGNHVASDTTLRLKRIQECTANNNCLARDLEFIWEEEKSLAISDQSFDHFSTAVYANDYYFKELKLLDINGDGVLDKVWVRYRHSNGEMRCLLSQEFDGQILKSYSSGYELNCGALELQPLDYNEDGRADLLVRRPGHSDLFLSTPQDDGTWKLEQVPYNGPDTLNLSIDADYNGPIHSEKQRFYSDMDGDGLVDFVTYASNKLRIYKKEFNGANIDSASNYHYASTPQALGINQGGLPVVNSSNVSSWEIGVVDRGLGQSDFNGDGMVDLLTVGRYFRETELVFGNGPIPTTVHKFERNAFIFTRSGDQFVFYSLLDPVFFEPDSNSETGIVVNAIPLDINGDGLTDLIGKTHYSLSTGTGFTAPIPLPAHLHNAVSHESFTQFDVNRDGFADLVFDGGYVPWNPNTQNFAGSKQPIGGSSGSSGTTTYLDLNGDGWLDMMIHWAGIQRYSFYKSESTGQAPPLFINEIRSGLGNRTYIHYQNLGESDHYTNLVGVNSSEQIVEQCNSAGAPGVGTVWEYCHSYPKYTTDVSELYRQLNDPLWWLDNNEPHLDMQRYFPMKEVQVPGFLVTQVDSSAPSTDNPNDLASVVYHYHHMRFQGGGRGMLGFEKLSTIDLQTGVTTQTRYRQDWPFTGQPHSTEVYSREGNLLRASYNHYTIDGFNKTGMENTLRDAGAAALGSLRVYLNRSEDIEYDLVNDGATAGDALSKTVSQFTQDTDGNTTQHIASEYSLDGGVESLFSRVTTTSSFGPGSDEKFLGRLLQSNVVSHRPGAQVQTKTRISKFTYYDINGACASSDSGHAGNLAGMLCEETLRVDGQDKTTTRHYYDRFGNSTYSLAEDLITGAKRLSSFSEYDSRGRYITKVFAPFNGELGAGMLVPDLSYEDAASDLGASIQLVSQVVSRNKYGTPLLTRNYSGAGASGVSETRVGTTPFGKVFFESNSNGSYSTVTSSLDTTDCPATKAVYSTHSTSADGRESKTCHDSMGRNVRSMTRGFNGTWVYVDTRYDKLGRVTRVSEPYFAGDTAYWTRVTQYDLLGRVTDTMHPFLRTDDEGNTLSSLATSSVRYQGLEIRYRNPNDIEKSEVRNVGGEVVSVTEDYNGSKQRSSSYEYDVYGNLVQMLDSAGNITQISYNGLGQKTAMNDPNKGAWTYQYNSFGDLLCQRDAKGQIIKNRYDFAGRLVERWDYTGGSCSAPTGNVAHAEWIYDTSPIGGLGQLDYELDNVSGYQKVYGYDSLGRPAKTKVIIPGESANDATYHYAKITYDNIGRLYQNFDAARNDDNFNRGAVQNEYNEYGFLERIVNANQNAPAGNREYYKVTGMNARGDVTAAELGEGVTQTTAQYNARSGRIENLRTENLQGALSGQILQNLTMRWDHVGNLAWRRDQGLKENGAQRNLLENFYYDNLNRLQDYVVSGNHSHSTSVAYNSIGNITSKSDVGGYSYASGRPNAVSSAGGVNYIYDANGSMTSDGRGRSLTYNTFDKVARLEKGGKVTEFFYGTDRHRFKRVDTQSNNEKTTTLYIGSVEKVYHPDNSVEWKRSIGGVALITHKFDSSGYQGDQIRYLHKDHLGSINLITDEFGFVTERMAFDPWGARRNVDSWQDLALAQISGRFYVAQKPQTTRGFTGHEMVDEMEIIHMNGRIYDALLGRFLQADPYIQAPTVIASLNRYSYVWNNPLNATDPTGYLSWDSFTERLKDPLGSLWNDHKNLKKELKPYAGTIVAIMFTIFAPQGAGVWYAMLAGGASGAAHAYVNGGNIFRGFAMGALSGAAFYGIGSTLDPGLSKIMAHATVGGVMSLMNGGKFGHGFASAGVTQAFSTMIGKIGGNPNNDRYFSAGNRAARVATSAVLGGTVSKATGGKFANGAITAAFSRAFNDEAMNHAQKDARAEALSKYGALEKKMLDFFEENPGGTYALTVDDINTIQEGFYYHRIKAPGFDDLSTVQQYEIADTILRVSPGGGNNGLSGKLFSWQGKTYYGGEVNYLGVGTLAASRNEIGWIPYANWAWNNVVQDGSLSHNQRQTVYGNQWATYGALRFRADAR